MHGAGNKCPVVFFDRDGTLNVERGYLRRVDDLVLIEGVAQAVRRLNQGGIKAILVSNQSGAARGYYPLSHIESLHKRLAGLLEEEGAHLDAVYYCPHLKEGAEPSLAKECDCRKPLTGLVDRAFAEHPELDPSFSFVVGDKTNDLGLANACGARCILVKTGYGQGLIDKNLHLDFKIDYQGDSVVDAVDWILKEIDKKAYAR
jgi:D-glycero-D-manno-heptose 1,7-bisphosphate phosphatase